MTFRPAAFAFCLCAIAAQLPADPPAIKTDDAVYPIPSPLVLPPAGGTFLDPTFGTTILRLTDEHDGNDNHVAYSYWPTFNKNSTRLIIHCHDGAFTYHFDPVAFKATQKQSIFDRPTPAGTLVTWEDSIWSGQDPDSIFANDRARLWRYDLNSGKFALLKDFRKDCGCTIGQMSRSIDDNVFAFTTSDSKGASGYLVWQRSPDRILLKNENRDIDEVQIDKSGQWLLIKTNKQGAGIVQDHVANLKTGTTENLIDNAPDFAPGHSDNGTGFCIGAENWTNRFLRRQFDSPHEFITIFDRKNDWTLEAHLSLLADDERWCIISFYEDKPSAKPLPFHGEIVQVATDGSQRLRRLAHHFSIPRGDYWSIPMANISRDGHFIAFTSNFGNATRKDVFILRVPDEHEK